MQKNPLNVIDIKRIGYQLVLRLK